MFINATAFHFFLFNFVSVTITEIVVPFITSESHVMVDLYVPVSTALEKREIRVWTTGVVTMRHCHNDTVL